MPIYTVVWSLTPLLASFLGSPTNPLAIHGILNPQATVLELGSGVSSILGLTLAFSQPSLRPARVVLSDQEYALRIARQNLEDNLHEAGHWEKLKEDVRPTYISYRVTGSSAKKNSGRETRHLEKPQTKSSMKVSPFSKTPSPSAPAILKTEPAIPLIVDLISLDWEQDSLRHHPAFRDHTRAKISLVIAIDCVYNESLVPHLIETCVDACSLPCPAAPKNVHAFESRGASETLVLIALELRSPDVLECFLEQFTKYFIVWRVPDSLLIQELRTGVDDECEGLGSGYVVYCGTLKGDVCVS